MKTSFKTFRLETSKPLHRTTPRFLMSGLKGLVLALAILSFSSSVQAQYSPPTAGLVAWWRGNGNANDSADGHNGTMMGGMGFTTGMFGQAFAGNSNQRMFVPDSSAFQLTQSLSIGAWVKMSAGYAVLQRGDSRGGFDPYQLSGDHAGHMLFQIESEGDLTVKTLSINMPYNQWQQVTATLDGSTGDMRIYLNGILTAQAFTTVRPFALLDPARAPGIAIGNTASDGDFPLIGSIDEVVLYNRALSPAEVASLVPEPGSATLIFLGLSGGLLIRRLRRGRSARTADPVLKS